MPAAAPARSRPRPSADHGSLARVRSGPRYGPTSAFGPSEPKANNCHKLPGGSARRTWYTSEGSIVTPTAIYPRSIGTLSDRE